jgi:hypothetical protein
VAVDTPGFVVLTVEGRDLVVKTTSRSAARVRATLEDLVACLQVAEKAAGPD